MGAFARAADRAQSARLDILARIIRSEFAEMPGMRLTRAQIRRLWSLRPREDDEVLSVLVAESFLVEGPDGRLGRRLDLM